MPPESKKEASKSLELLKKPDESAVSELTREDLLLLRSTNGLKNLLKSKNIKYRKALRNLKYERDLKMLQIELVKLQRTVQLSGRRIAILFEGRDAAGKGGAIRRFIEHLNPRSMRVVALPKPTDVEKGQWYFQRYAKQLPNPGEITFFDRSWYNRAVVEPVMNFCNQEEYEIFMQQVPEFEHMLYEDGVELIKFWFSISKEEQHARFTSRKRNLLKQWKISPVDDKAQDNWDIYTKFKKRMFSKTHTSYSPWIIVKANNKKRARLESIRHVLNTLPYDGKEKPKIPISPNPNIIQRFHRSAKVID